MASLGQSLLLVLALSDISSATSSNIFRNVVELVLHPKETIDAIVESATDMASKIPDAVLVKALENSRRFLTRPHPLLGIPALDPYCLRHLDITHNLPAVSRMEGVVDGVAVRGLSTYRVKRLAVDWKSCSANVSLVFPEIDADGHYSVNGTFAEFLPVFGEGPFRLNVRDLELSTVLCLSYSNKSLSVDAMDLDYSFHNFESKFGGLMGGQDTGELVNEVINDRAPQLLRSMEPVLKPIAVQHILGGVNACLRKVPLSKADLLSWLSGGSRLHGPWRGAEHR